MKCQIALGNLCVLSTAVAMAALANDARTQAAVAQPYPAKPIRIVVPFPQGRCTGSRRGGWWWGGDGARPPGLWHRVLKHVISALSAAVLLLPQAAVAQPYPSKPIRIVVPFPPGGTSDILARTLGQKLTEEWGQQIVVDNRAGAGANIGAEVAAKSAPDGYTLFVMSTAHTINPSLYSKLAYDTVKDFTPITMLVATSQVLVVHNSVPVKTVKEFIAFAKKRPGELLYSSAGNGSQPHLSAELFKTMTGINIVHVPYKGAPPAMIDLLAGHVALTFATAPSAVPYVKAGQLRALGVSTAKRIAALPDVPTIAEAGVKGYEAAGWNGLVGPAGMQPAIVDKLNGAFVKILRTPAVATYLSGQGADPDPGTPAEFAAYIKSEIAKWAKVVKDSGAKVD